MPVKDIARPRDQLVTVDPDTPVTEVAARMDDRSVGSVVVAENDDPRGIVTDRDLTTTVVKEGADPNSVVAADCMTPDPFTVDAGDGVAALCRGMREHSVRRVPVTEDGKLAGIVTADDLLVLIEGEMSDISEVIRAESPPYSATRGD